MIDHAGQPAERPRQRRRILDGAEGTIDNDSRFCAPSVLSTAGGTPSAKVADALHETAVSLIDNAKEGTFC